MATENKEDLIKKVAVLELENSKLREQTQEFILIKKQLSDVLKSKEEITSSEHTVRKELERLKIELEEEKNKKLNFSKEKETEYAASIKEKILVNTNLQNQVDHLKADLNKLASLFDEYIVAYQDQTKMLSVFVKNTQTVEKYLSGKIDEYNGGSKK